MSQVAVTYHGSLPLATQYHHRNAPDRRLEVALFDQVDAQRLSREGEKSPAVAGWDGICPLMPLTFASMTQIESTETTATLIAVFGNAELVQISKGRLALRGGNTSDFIEAREWVSMFMPESILRQP